jgi:hypothetical protein
MKKSVLKLNKKLELNGKLMLESLYSGYINGLMLGFDDEEFEDLIGKLVDFRLSVSGGSESNMGYVGMNYVESFFDEVLDILYLIDDWSGQYRGDFNYENFEEFELCLNNLEFELNGEDVKINDEDKKLLIEEFKKRLGLDDDEE